MGVSEVVSVGRLQVVGVRVVVCIVVKEEDGYTEALRYSHPHASMLGGGVVVAATAYPPSEVGGQPAHCVVFECGVCE